MYYAWDLEGERPGLTDHVILSKLLYPSNVSPPLSYILVGIAIKFVKMHDRVSTQQMSVLFLSFLTIQFQGNLIYGYELKGITDAYVLWSQKLCVIILLLA